MATVELNNYIELSDDELRRMYGYDDSHEVTDGELYEAQNFIWEGNNQLLREYVGDWLNKRPKATKFKVDYHDVSWRKLSGSFTIDVEQLKQHPWRVMSSNGDWRQEWGFERGRIVVTQYHHDSPTGETFVITRQR